MPKEETEVKNIKNVVIFVLAASCCNNAMAQETNQTDIDKTKSNNRMYKDFNGADIRLKGGGYNEKN